MVEDIKEEGAALLVARTDYAEPTVFLPENMLRETQRQRQLVGGTVPAVCVLDPDGDIVRLLVREGRATQSMTWSCYHTELWETVVQGVPIGIIGCVVGAPFAVLVAEQLFVSGCRLLVSIASAGRIASALPDSCVVLIDRALRGEGTSYGYLPPSPAVDADPDLITGIAHQLRDDPIPVRRGTSWTTDSPYRETQDAIAKAAMEGALVVEMEAAGLYAFAAARSRRVVCFAHVTNTMAVTEGDFEKGPSDGVEQALTIVAATIRAWQETP